jgi:methyltransferase (TIGR00027 family)
MSGVVSHISDTARWVAVYRALESRRPDALFHDRFAERLAGPRGHEIAANIWDARRYSWPVIARTRVIDDFILASIADGCDRVLNLAAGLDTRPYRLALPRELNWIEADLPGMIEDKEQLLAGETPVCQLSREKVDLADANARTAFLARTLAGAKKALVLTEGLLVYLPAATVSLLARDLYARPEIAWWMTDLGSPALIRRMEKSVNLKLSHDAQMMFGPPDGVAFFRPFGWKARDVRSLFRAASAWRRLPPFLQLLSRIFKQDPPPDNPGRQVWAAIVRFERA